MSLRLAVRFFSQQFFMANIFSNSPEGHFGLDLFLKIVLSFHSIIFCEIQSTFTLYLLQHLFCFCYILTLLGWIDRCSYRYLVQAASSSLGLICSTIAFISNLPHNALLDLDSSRHSNAFELDCRW
jgi:uncharacterized membrane protein